MASSGSDQTLKTDIRRHMVLAFFVVFFLCGGVVAWAALTEIAGAVVSVGKIVVEGNIKQIQHQEGGIVKTIFVENGDRVQAGDMLIQLNDTVTRANLAVITKQLDVLYAQEMRLVAEQDSAAQVRFRTNDLGRENLAGSTIIEDSQIRLFHARRNSLLGQKQQLQEQIRQFEKQIEGLQAQRDSKAAGIELINSERKDLVDLLSQKLVSASRVYVLDRERAELEGEFGGFVAQIAQTREAVSERHIQILQLDEEFLASVLLELQDVRSKIAQLEEQKIAAQDQLTRVEIRAPRSGLIHNLSVHTIGQVLAPGEVAMSIVPQEDHLVVEAQMDPTHIDQIAVDQQATIRFPSFDQRTTPELMANVKTISADLLQDQATGLNFYLVRLAIPETELSKLGDKNLVPGMPVESFIETKDRTVLSYLIKPIADQIEHAMRER